MGVMTTQQLLPCPRSVSTVWTREMAAIRRS